MMPFLQLKIVKSLLILVYALTIVVMSRYAIKHSEYDLDILFYTACAMEETYLNKVELHKQVYHMAYKELGPQKYNRYIDSSKQFRKKLFKEPDTFMDLLPYYKSKALYVALLKTAYQQGYSPITFSTLLNIICYVLISIVFLSMLLTYLNFMTGFTIAYLSLLMPTFTGTLISNTPDIMTACLFLMGVFFFLQQQSWLHYLSLVLFPALVVTRPENILFVCILAGLGVFFFGSVYPKKFFLLLAIFCLGAYFANSSAIAASSWKDLYKLTNLPLEDVHSLAGELSIREYVLGLRRIPNNLFHCEVAFIFLMTLLPLVNYKRLARKPVFYLLLVSNLAFLVTRILLLPDITNRYFCGSFLLSVLCYFILNKEQENTQAQSK